VVLSEFILMWKPEWLFDMTLVAFCRSIAALLFVTVEAVSVALFLVFNYNALGFSFVTTGASQ
jgi:hypothetical protein